MSKHAKATGLDKHSSFSLVPRARGQLVALRTRAELKARHETIDVFVCNVPVKDTGKVLRAIKSIAGQDTADLHHLRRVVKVGFHPTWLRERHATAANSLQLLKDELMSSKVDDEPIKSHTSEMEDQHGVKSDTVHILLSPVSVISRSDIHNLLEEHLPHIYSADATASPDLDPILTVAVPLHPPASPAQAVEQSNLLWPTTYNPNTVYGPNPSELAAAQLEIQLSAGSYIALARRAALEACNLGRGEAVGVVVVETSVPKAEGIDSNANTAGEKHDATVVCVAGDARYCNQASNRSTVDDVPPAHSKDSCTGNPANHAVLRAIDMVASKRRLLLSPPSAPPAVVASGFSPDLTPLEEQYFSMEDTLQPNGYLCLNLQVYCTHEPCVMCSMALVHSRVGRVVFARRMERTGGLCAEEEYGGLGYGLFWRPELNWRFLCWRWEENSSATAEIEPEADAVDESDSLEILNAVDGRVHA